MDRFFMRTPNNNSRRISKGLADNTLKVIQLNCGKGGLICVAKKRSSTSFFTKSNQTLFYCKRLGSATRRAHTSMDM